MTSGIHSLGLLLEPNKKTAKSAISIKTDTKNTSSSIVPVFNSFSIMRLIIHYEPLFVGAVGHFPKKMLH